MSSEAAPVTVTISPTPTSPKPAAKKATKAKAPKPAKAPKAKKAKTPSSHPTYGDMIRRAITDLKDKKGSSRAAILKYILQHNKVGENIVQINAHLRQALKRGVSTGALKQVKGVGASGSFRLGEKISASKKPGKIF
jgi:histone H1/5